MKGIYGDKVEKIAVSNRVVDTPCLLVTSQYGYSANMERIMQSQAFADNKRTSYLVSKKTMEINPRHPIMIELKNAKMSARPGLYRDAPKGLLIRDTAPTKNRK